MATVSFGGPLEFGVVGFGDSATRDARNDSVPAAATVTAAIVPASASASFSIISVTAYDVTLVEVLSR